MHDGKLLPDWENTSGKCMSQLQHRQWHMYVVRFVMELTKFLFNHVQDRNRWRKEWPQSFFITESYKLCPIHAILQGMGIIGRYVRLVYFNSYF